MNEVRGRASDWVQRAAIRFKGMIDEPGHPAGDLAIVPEDTTMLKTISAALLAASVLAVVPAMAHGPGRTAHAPARCVNVVHVNPGVLNANARMGRHHHTAFPSSPSLPPASLKLIRGGPVRSTLPRRALADNRPGPLAIASPMAGGPDCLCGTSGPPDR